MKVNVAIQSDDTEVNRRLSNMIEDRYSIHTFTNLDQLLEKMKRISFSAIVVDCRKDCITDDKRVAMLKTLGNQSDNRLLILADDKKIRDIQKIVGSDSLNFLPKPILYTAFVDIVDRLVRFDDDTELDMCDRGRPI